MEWKPPYELSCDDNFIIEPLPHGCDACKGQHTLHTADWVCTCIYCVQGPTNAYEYDIRRQLNEWVAKGSPIWAQNGSIPIYTFPCPVDVEVTREFGLCFEKGSDRIVQRDWSSYKYVHITKGGATFLLTHPMSIK